METFMTESVTRIHDPGSAQTQTAKTILLAEDDREMRRLLEFRLRREGYEVESCHNGFELLRNIDCYSGKKGRRFDLIVSDIRMPGFTGMEILEYVNANGGSPPMILISAFGDDDTRAKAKMLKAVSLLDKPFDLDLLAELVHGILDVPESLSVQGPSLYGSAGDFCELPLEIIFHRYPRQAEWEWQIKEASRALLPFRSDLLSCRIVLAGSGPGQDASSIVIRGLVVVPRKVFAVSSGSLSHMTADHCRAAVDRLFATLKGRMEDYFADIPHARSA